MWYDTTFKVQITSKEDRQFSVFVLNSYCIQPSECKYVLFVCLCLRLQESFILLHFRYFGQIFSFHTVDLSGESRVVPPTLLFSWERIEIIFCGCWWPWKLKAEKNNPHVFETEQRKLAMWKYPIIRYPSWTCIIWLASKTFTLWWTKSRLNDFDSYFTYYSTDMARTCTIRLTSMPFIDDHHHGWVILPCISLILRHVLVRLVSSDLPRRRSRSDEQSHVWVILTCISLIIQQIWQGPAPLDSHWWLQSIDDNHYVVS